MTITRATLDISVATGTDAASYDSASIAPTAGRLALMAVTNRRSAGTATLPTCTGWDLVDTQTFDDNAGTLRGRITLFRSMGLASGVQTVDFGGVTQLGCIIHIFEFDGVDTSGSNGAGAIVQTVKGEGVASATLTLTLAAFGDVANGAFACFGQDANITFTPDTGWSEIGDTGHTGPGAQQESVWRADNDTTVIGAPISGTPDMGGIAVEIKAAGAAAVQYMTTNQGYW